MKQSLKTIYTIIMAALLAACETAIPVPIIATTATPVPSLVQVSPTPSVFPTPSPMPVTATPTIPAATLTAVPISSLPLSSAPDRLRIAYIGEDENIYLQNAGDVPLQLTYDGGHSTFLFSDDGERLTFYHDPDPSSDSEPVALHSIHIDGTQEKVLLTTDLLKSLGLGYNEFTIILSRAYVPGTHQLLFNTRQANEQLATLWPYHDNTKRNLDLLSIDVDTGELKSLLPPGQGGNFVIAPDGTMVAIQASGHIDVVSIDGQVIRQNLVTYTPTTPHELIPDMFWTEDSIELLVTLPIDPIYQYTRAQCTTDIAARGVWRYAIDGGVGVQTLLNPPPRGESNQGSYFVDFDVSPDGNWILYEYDHNLGCEGVVEDETVTHGRYLGNLREGTAQLYAHRASPVWSPDSRHFVYEVEVAAKPGLFLGSVDEPPVWLDVSRWYVLGWADPTHYVAFYLEDGSVVGLMGEIGGEIIYFPTSVPVSSFEDFNRYYMFDFIYLDQER